MKNTIISFSMRSLVTTLLLMVLIFLVSCQSPNNVQATYTPQQDNNIGGGCGVSPVAENNNYQIKYVEIKNSL